MAGFETVVRPMILPNIRPAPARSVVPADDPEHGQCVIAGHDTGTFTQSYSLNISVQKASATEHKRKFDEVRIHPKQRQPEQPVQPVPTALAAAGAGYIDVEVVTKLWLNGSDGKKFTRNYAPIEEASNIQILRRDMTR